MITKKSSNLTTKQDLSKLERSLKTDINSLRRDFGGMKNGFSGMKRDFTSLKEDVIKMKDEILGEIRDMRDENSLITGRNAINRDMLEDHENRISKLETASFAKAA